MSKESHLQLFNLSQKVVKKIVQHNIITTKGLLVFGKGKDGTRIKFIRNGCQPPNYVDDRAHRKRKRNNKDMQAPYRKNCVNRYQNLVTLLLISCKVRLGGKN